jgi:hypothetical protein
LTRRGAKLFYDGYHERYPLRDIVKAVEKVK